MDYRGYGNPISTGVGQRNVPPPPPGTRRLYRDFSRYDYSHDANPMVVPHVREYEHGLWGQGIPVFDPRVPPPPIVNNSVSQNPYLADHYAPRSHSFTVDSFQSLRRDMFNDNPPSVPKGSLTPGMSLNDLLSRFHSLESKFALLEVENKMLRGRGVQGGVLSAVDHVVDGSQDEGLSGPTGDGNYTRNFSGLAGLFCIYFDRLQWDLGDTRSLCHCLNSFYYGVRSALGEPSHGKMN